MDRDKVKAIFVRQFIIIDTVADFARLIDKLRDPYHGLQSSDLR